MKMLNHPNIVNLVEVIDDPNIDKFYMGMSVSTVIYIFILLLKHNMCILSTLYTIATYIFFFSFALPVLEYVEGKMVCDNGLEEATARKYLRDIISGLMYLHSHVRCQFFISVISVT